MQRFRPTVIYATSLFILQVPYKIYEWKIFAATKNDNEMTHGEHDDVSQEVYQVG